MENNINLLFSILEGWLCFALAYHYFLLLTSCSTPRLTTNTSNPSKCLAIAIPAHNEASVIGKTVQQLLNSNYPAHLFKIFVVADHCQDNTYDTATLAGAICFQRNEGLKGRKGYALTWLIEKILSEWNDCNAIIILDADSQVNPNFLYYMDQGLNNSFMVLQGQHIISNQNESLYNQFAAIDMRLNNRLRNVSRHNLGSSCRLMGDAMCFSRQVLEQFPWNTHSLVEDMEYGIHLLLNNVKITYIPQAISLGQAAGNWHHAQKQRLRWEKGVVKLRYRLGFQLLLSGIATKRLGLIDRAIELLLPPYSVLTMLTLLLVIIKLLWLLPSIGLFPSFYILMMWVIFPFIGLVIDRAPIKTFLVLGYAPIYLAWRLWISFISRIHKQPIIWIKTPRQEDWKGFSNR